MLSRVAPFTDSHHHRKVCLDGSNVVLRHHGYALDFEVGISLALDWQALPVAFLAQGLVMDESGDTIVAFKCLQGFLDCPRSPGPVQLTSNGPPLPHSVQHSMQTMTLMYRSEHTIA